MSHLFTLVTYVLFALISTSTLADSTPNLSYAGKKILYINSYHTGFEWSDEIALSIQTVLKDTGIDLKTLEMDTKNHTEEAFAQQAALRAKALIEEFKPDVVIASDDNASKYLIMPYYKDADLPFVFCGIDWDASVYGFPYKNVTGMEEISLEPQVLKLVKEYAKGERKGILSVKHYAQTKSVDYQQKLFNFKYDKIYFVETFEDWKAKYLKLQEEVDIVFLLSPVGIKGWDFAEAQRFVEEHTKIPSATTTNPNNMRLSMMGISRIPSEQGIYAAKTALRILDGVSPSDIPITQNKEGQLFLNFRIGKKLGIIFKPALLKVATVLH